MEFVKDERESRDIAEFAVLDEVYYGLRLSEQPEYDGLKEKAQVISRSLARLKETHCV